MREKDSTLSWIFKNTGFILWHIVILTIISMLLSACAVYLAPVSKQVLDIATGEAQGVIWDKMWLIVAFLAAQIVLQVLYSSLHIRILGKLEITFKSRLFTGLLKKDWQSVSAYHSGELLNRLTNDVNVISSSVINIIPNIASLLVKLIMSFVILLSLDYTFAIIMLCVSPIVMIMSKFYKKKMKSFHKLCQETEGRTRSYMQETLQNILVIKSFRAEDYANSQGQELQRINYKFRIKRNTISILANMGMFIALTAGYYFALAYGAYKLSLGIIGIGTLTAMLQLVGQLQTPFKGFAEILPQYYSALASAERIMELEQLPQDEMSDSFDALETYRKMKTIEFSHITFGYGEDSILEDASLTLNKGEFICIAGISGIGKSTLLRLALGFIHPECGNISILLDDNKTIPVNGTTRKLFAYVPQGNMILSGTIRDNIKFLYTNAGEDEVIAAAKTAQIWADIESMPEGLDTVLGEKGSGLSEGQIQRIAIARALLSDAPVLLLDEATSALDEATEAALLSALRELENKSCIIVSHKAAAIKSCDKTVYIENKRVVTH